MHAQFDELYEYHTTILLTNDTFFRYRQTGNEQRRLENFLYQMHADNQSGKAPVFVVFTTLNGRCICVNYSKIRHIRMLYDSKAHDMHLPLYNDHFGIGEINRRTNEELANDERQHRMHKAQEEGHPDDPMPDAAAEEAEAFLATMDMDLENELPGIALTPTTMEADDDIPDVIVYTAYPTGNQYAENALAEHSYFYYDLEKSTLAGLDSELECGDIQRRFLCLTDADGDEDNIPLHAIWLMELSRNVLEPENSEEEDWTLEEEDNDEQDAGNRNQQAEEDLGLPF